MTRAAVVRDMDLLLPGMRPIAQYALCSLQAKGKGDAGARHLAHPIA